MHITVGIPSRGRPLELAAAVLALEKTRCTGHDVQYRVAIDNDDYATWETCHALSALAPVMSSLAPRPVGLGEIHNDLVCGTDPASTFMLWSDRLVPVTAGWDEAIAEGVRQFPSRVLWMDSLHLAGPGQFILPPAYRAALAGPPCPAVYPFWFDDSAVEEVDILAFGPPRLSIAAKAAGPRTDKTNRCREIDFWIRLFAATRRERMVAARQIRFNLGLQARDMRGEVAIFEARDNAFLARVPELTAQWGATGSPDATYLAAKARAEQIMMELA